MDIEMNKTKRYWILFNTCIATFMATVDGSIVNIALPVISNNFSVSISTVQWIVTAYLLTISSILLIWGKISDIYGSKFLFTLGIGIFTLGSLLCGISGSFTMLVLSRVVQAIGGSIAMALVQGIVTSIFPQNERGKALGVVATVVAIGSLVGPSLGGILVHGFGWRSIFYINIPVGILGVVLTLFIMPKTSVKAVGKKFDLAGSFMFVVSMLLLFIGLLSVQNSFVAPQIMVSMIIAAVVLIVVFVFFEKGRENPLLDMKLFKNLTFSFGLICAFLTYLTIFVFVFFMPFYLQFALKLDVLTAGLIMSVYPIVTGVLAPIFGWLSDRISYKILTTTGQIISSFALVFISMLNLSSTILHICLVTAMLGVGNAMFQSPNTSSIMGSVAKKDVGVAGSVNAFFRNFGFVSGTTFSVMLFVFVTKLGINDIGSGIDSNIFLKGFNAVMIGSAVLLFVGVFFSIVRVKDRN